MPKYNKKASIKIKVVKNSKNKINYKNYLPAVLPIAASLFLILQLVAPIFHIASVEAGVKPSINLDQGSNGKASAIIDPVNWVNGNLNENHAHYVEGQSVPYRAIFSGLTVGDSYTFNISFDIMHGGKHAIDFLTKPRRIAEQVNPCDGYSTCVAGPGFDIPIPLISTPNTRTYFNNLETAEGNQQFAIYNGTITSISYSASGDETSSGNSEATVSVTFTAADTTTIIAWGGHIAREFDWGVGQGATGISGSPYHTSIDGQDRSLKASAVLVGNLTVIKHVDNTGGGTNQASDFTITVTGINPSQTSFPGSESGTTINLSPGAYSVDELPVVNYTKTLGTGCSGTITAGQIATCTITNTYNYQPPTTGTLTVVKVVNNNYGGTAQISDFSLFVDQTQVTSGVPEILPAGDYVVSETGPTGYEATYSDDCDEQGNITIVAGQDYTCTITNDDIQPSITVVKEVVDGEAQVSDFPLFVDDTPVVSGEINYFNAGLHIVSEVNPFQDYIASFNGDCDRQGNVNLGIGQDLICTIINTFLPPELPRLGVHKVLVPEDDAGVFELKIDGVTVGIGEKYSGTYYRAVSIGSHTVSETAVYGTNLDDYTITIGGDCQPDGTVTLAAGEEKICTITNTKLGTIIIEKDTVPDSDTDFEFTSQTLSSPFYLDDDEDQTLENTQTFSGLTPGTYDIAETTNSDYETTVSCSDESNPNAISLGPGKTVTCIFTNTLKEVPPPPTYDLAVTKEVDNQSPEPGTEITYTITATNNSSVEVSDVYVDDLFPSSATFVSASTTHGSYDEISSVWTIGTLTAGETATLEIKATVNSGTEGQSIVNTATVGSDDEGFDDGNSDNDSASATSNVPKPPDVLPPGGGGGTQGAFTGGQVLGEATTTPTTPAPPAPPAPPAGEVKGEYIEQPVQVLAESGFDIIAFVFAVMMILSFSGIALSFRK